MDDACGMGMMGMDFMAKLKALLEEAKTAADARNPEKASEKIAEAQKLLEEHHKAMHDRMERHMREFHGGMGMGGKEGKGGMGPKCPVCGAMIGAAEGKVANKVCPIMGLKIDPEKTPESRTRMFGGMKVGFCCDMCPGQWDKLSDEEKQKKLDAVREK